MDIASMVLGIVSLIFSFLCWFIAIITAPIGLILGIVDLLKKKKENMPNKGMAISGIIMNSIAIVIIIFIVIAVFVFAVSAPDSLNQFNNL